MAWIHAVQNHVLHNYRQQGGSELLYFILDNMLVEDPDERSSADYCHDEALKLLQRINDARRPESTPSDTESSTPKPSILQSNVKSESDEASTIRLDPQSDSRDGSETLPRRTEESINSSLIANLGYRDGSLIDSLVNLTDSEENWERSGAQGSDTQPSRVPAISVALLQGSIVDELLLASVRRSGRQDSEAAKELRQMGKRTWPADASPSVSLPRSFTHPLSGAATQQHADASNRDSKGPDHKRGE